MATKDEIKKGYDMRKLLFLMSMLGWLGANIATVSANDAAILTNIDENFDKQLLLLEELVNQNSGTLNVEGVQAVGKIFDREFIALGFQTKWIDMPEEMGRGGHFVATRTFGKGPHILLVGHLDTVFEKDSPFQKFERDGEYVKGPGVVDMKGGDVVILYALKALIEAGDLTAGKITVFFTGDEESVGAPRELARREFIKAGKNADVALNFEGGSNEWAVIGRRGSSSWVLKVSGQRAHSSGVFGEYAGAGAIFELSRILNRFYGEVRGPFGLTFNPGVVAGGTSLEQGESVHEQSAYGKTNVVAQTAIARGGLRFMNEDQLERARAAMLGIVEDSLPKTSAEIIFKDGYPAMEETDANKALLAKLNQVHERLGLAPAKSFPPERRGAADISFIAPYVTSMDGLGVSGSGSHGIDERMHVESLRDATRRSALLIYDLLNE